MTAFKLPRIIEPSSMPEYRLIGHLGYHKFYWKVEKSKRLMKQYRHKPKLQDGEMPCRQKMTICYESRCLNRFDCEAFEAGKKRGGK